MVVDNICPSALVIPRAIVRFRANDTAENISRKSRGFFDGNFPPRLTLRAGFQRIATMLLFDGQTSLSRCQHRASQTINPRDIEGRLVLVERLPANVIFSSLASIFGRDCGHARCTQWHERKEKKVARKRGKQLTSGACPRHVTR